MTSDIRDIHRYIDALTRRERRLLVGETLLRGGGVAAVLVGLLAVSSATGLDRAEAAAGVVLWGGLGSWWLVVAPFLRRWGQMDDRLRQARLVEAREPRLQGRLVATADRPHGARAGESEAIVALSARRARGVLGAHTPEVVHSARSLRRMGAATLAMWFAVVAMGLAVPGGPARALGWWWGQALAAVTVRDATLEGAEAAARVGDISLRYVYPDYTGLEPYVVANSTGEAHAPPGTRVHVVARSDEAVASAALVAYGEPALDAGVVDGRQIEASFVVQAREGTYELVTYTNGEAKTSPSFDIVAEPDLPPEVSLVDVPAVMEVPIDRFLNLGWTARDDYGISRVSLEVSGQVREPPLRRARERRADVSGLVEQRPQDLGMLPGETYEVAVVAWDNDTWSGSKAGRSQVVRVVVLDEDGVARLTPERRRELRDLMVDALADNLEEPYPPGRAGGDFARWGEAVSARYDGVAAFLDSHRSRLGGIDADLRTSEMALEAVQTLVRYTQVSFVPGSRETANAGSTAAVSDFREDAVMLTEDAILDLDQLIAAAAFRAIADSAEDLTWESQELSRRLSGEEMDAMAMLVAMEAIDELLRSIDASASDLREGGMKRFVSARTTENMRLSDEVKSSLASDDQPRARRMAGRLQQRLGEMAAGIREELERLKEQGKQGQSEVQSLLEELEAIIGQQDDLAESLAEQAAAAGDARVQQLQSIWDAVERAAQSVHDDMDRFAQALESSGRSFNEREFVDWAKSETEGVLDAVDFRDLSGAMEGADELHSLWQRYALRYEQLYLGREDKVRGPDRARIRSVQRQIDELHDVLEQLRRADSAADPSLRSLAQSQRSAQRALRDRLEVASRDAKRVAQEFPVTPRGMEEALAEGGKRMEQADGDLGRGDALQAEGSQRAASMHIQEAVDALQQAMRAAQRQQQEMSGGGSGQDEESGEESGQSGMSEQEIGSFQLPEPEAFMTPEAYRQALLEGMAGNVPEAYRAMKRRYYEELVHQ